MVDIVDVFKIIDEELDVNNYLESFLNLGLKHDVISQVEYKYIIFKLYKLLEQRIKKYTGGLRSSVSIYTAKNINQSNMWIIALYLRKLSVQEAYQVVLQEDIFFVFDKGALELKNNYKKTRFFYYAVFVNNIIKIDNYFYNSTLKEGIKSFFSNYNISYDAMNMVVTIDYNPLIGRPDSCGVLFVSEYLRWINYENVFCQKFTNKKICSLLRRVYLNYEEMTFNICEIVLIYIVILEFLGKNIFQLNEGDINVGKLYKEYNSNKETFYDMLIVSYNNSINRLNLNKDVQSYFSRCEATVLNKIIKAFQHQTVEILLGIVSK